MAAATVALIVSALAACASTPEQVPALDQARAAVDRLAAEPRAGEVAAQPLSAARGALGRAEGALQAGEPLPVIEHQAYLAQRHAEIGLEMVNEAESIAAVRAAE
jgi:hypothetical protein